MPLLSPYTGSWTFDEAAHLLRRTVFDHGKIRIEQAIDEGLQGSINTLFSDAEIPDPPIHFRFEEDPHAGLGESWVGKPSDPESNYDRNRSLWSWWMLQMSQNNQTIHEKMTLFWHNHFAIADIRYAEVRWIYLNILRQFSIGDFRELTKQITVCRAMLIYLGGEANQASSPNENYARELLELFTLGKGQLAAPGDYTTFTEDDVLAFARALTGWTYATSTYGDQRFAVFQNAKHDSGIKQLSHRFNDAVIYNEGAEEYKRVIDVIFEKEEVALHLSRRLYIWFVNFEITDLIETEVIAPMAQLIIADDYNIKSALMALLSSEHFYDLKIRGAIIKNPIDYFMSFFHGLQMSSPQELIPQYYLYNRFYWDVATSAGFQLFETPSPAGWPAFHQSPIFYKAWITSSYLKARKEMFNFFISGLREGSPDLKGHDFLKFISTFENPSNVNDLINEVCKIIYPREINEAQKVIFKNILIPGLPDFEWTVEYNNYLQSPNDLEVRDIIENKLKNLFIVMINLPEFQLS